MTGKSHHSFLLSALRDHVLDQSLGQLSSARRDENIAINLPVNVDRQLQRAEEAVKAPNNP